MDELIKTEKTLGEASGLSLDDNMIRNSYFSQRLRNLLVGSTASFAVLAGSAMQSEVEALTVAADSEQKASVFDLGGNHNPYAIDYDEVPLHRALSEQIAFDRNVAWGLERMKEVPVHPDRDPERPNSFTHGFFVVFNELPEPIGDLPAIVLGVNQNNEVVRLNFSAELTLPELQDRFKQIIFRDSVQSTRLQNAGIDEVDVGPLPISDFYVRCYDSMSFDNEILATGYSRGMVGATQIQFSLTTDPEQLEKLKEAAARGTLMFEFAYRIEEKRHSTGEQRPKEGYILSSPVSADFVRSKALNYLGRAESHDRQLQRLSSMLKERHEDLELIIEVLSSDSRELEQLKSILNSEGQEFSSSSNRSRWRHSTERRIQGLLGCSDCLARRLVQVADRNNVTVYPAPRNNPIYDQLNERNRPGFIE